MKKRILIKISGASLKSEKDSINATKLKQLANQIKQLKNDYLISIVFGGGNIFRGGNAKELNMNRSYADNMGMLATLINGLAFKTMLDGFNIESTVLSALRCDQLTTHTSLLSIEQAIKDDHVLIFVGGTGFPYFTTDTNAALKALETETKIILMGKNGVDGIYTKDPLKNKDAEFIPQITYHEAFINNKIKIMDQTALALCEENDLELIVFNIDKENAIVDVLNNKIRHTIVKKEFK
ncbi:UMP kinase [Ureaplasma canigenitalium]|uniref:UMP kinase n=1 Tax=Ureaplasma canigenitalium TaxID=42092 RepID=UPI0004E1BA4B|nr:UMP kinase [Ureaplasma canigenitalium]